MEEYAMDLLAAAVQLVTEADFVSYVCAVHLAKMEASVWDLVDANVQMVLLALNAKKVFVFHPV